MRVGRQDDNEAMSSLAQSVGVRPHGGAHPTRRRLTCSVARVEPNMVISPNMVKAHLLVARIEPGAHA